MNATSLTHFLAATAAEMRAPTQIVVSVAGSAGLRENDQTLARRCVR